MAVLSEAIGRGATTTALGGSRTGWVLEWAPSMLAGGAGRLYAVTRALREERCRQLREAVLSGRVGVDNAAVVLDEMDRLEPRLVPEAVPTVWDGLITVAEGGGPRDIRKLRPRLLAEHGRPPELQELQDRAKRRVMLSQPRGDGDGVFEYLLRLDTEGMAALEAGLDPLSAPRPAEGLPDLRPAPQRRGDALVELVRRAVAAADGVPVSPKAQLFVTVAHDDLQRELGGGSVVGTLQAGTMLGIGTLRRMACDAGIIPTLLGSAGQVLDLGQSTRLFTPVQTKALWLRDGSCTLPGCGMAATWCAGHHLVHWADGGPTDLDNGALLCGVHHQLVHDRRLLGELVDGHVEWDLRPGSYDRALAAAAPARAGPGPPRGVPATGPPRERPA